MRIRKAEAGDISAWMQILHLVEQYFPGLCPEEYEKELEESIGREEALVAVSYTHLDVYKRQYSSC